MNEQQEFLLNLLMEFDGICQKHGIEYVLCGGCAIGVERNHGFLPWDDDVDLWITRDNLIKLDKVLKSELPEGRIWVTQENTPGYENPIPRYMDSNSTLVIRSWMDTGIPLAFMLELFVLDPYPNDPKLQEDFNKYLWLYCELQADRYVIASWNLGKDTIDADLYREYKARVDREGKEAVLAEIEREHLTYSYDECDYLCGRWGLDHKVVRKEWVEDIVRRDFEGKSLPFFRENIQYIFETEYGYDWNIVPTDAAKVTHDNIVRVDEPYTQHLEEITDIAQRYQVRNQLEKNKVDNIERLFSTLDLQEAAAVQKQAILQAMAEKLEKKTWSFELDKLEVLFDDFKEFFDIQFAQRYSKFKKRVTLRDDLLRTMLLTLLHRNNVTKCEKLLDLYPEWEDYGEFKDVITDTCEVKNKRYAGDIDAIGVLLKKMEGRHDMQWQVEVERSRMWYYSQTAKDPSDAEIDEAIGLLKHATDYEVMKYVGDVYYQKGDFVEAAKWYGPAMKSRNGVVLLDLNDKGFYC